MKKYLLILVFLMPLFAFAQSIPNGNFESWIVFIWYENPEFWTTDNTEIQYTVTKDSDSWEGDFAMRVTAQPSVIGEYGEASTLFEISSVPAALNFYAKSENEFGSVGVEITFLNQENEIYTEYWYSSENMEEYTQISIPLEQIEPIITHARIRVTAQVGDLVPGSAWISVDDMAFGEPLNVKQEAKTYFKIFPNPTNEMLTVQSPDGILGNLIITDMQGKTVYTDFINDIQTSINIKDLAPGSYILNTEKNTVQPSKFMVK